MNSIVTTGIILTRVDYAETDRIISFITPDQGKISAMVRGARKTQSKMAGGIELFCISEITYIKGRKELDTLISARLKTHFGNINKDYERTMLGYEMLKAIQKVTEQHAEPGHFELIQQALGALNDTSLSRELAGAWFYTRLLKLEGRLPQLQLSADGRKLEAADHFSFDFTKMSFAETGDGQFGVNHIKFLRLAAGQPWQKLSQVKTDNRLLTDVYELAKQIHQFAGT